MIPDLGLIPVLIPDFRTMSVYIPFLAMYDAVAAKLAGTAPKPGTVGFTVT